MPIYIWRNKVHMLITKYIKNNRSKLLLELIWHNRVQIKYIY